MFVLFSHSNGMARLAVRAALFALAVFVPPALAQPDKPNILIIMGDDIGQFNISA